mmetsp:Transcript_43123/g.99910  ORF Transcript_43123/g.99910 Transcript_43123/m.99910 type:complete len:252 (+) Transcript_43123:78-833(+)
MHRSARVAPGFGEPASPAFLRAVVRCKEAKVDAAEVARTIVTLVLRAAVQFLHAVIGKLLLELQVEVVNEGDIVRDARSQGVVQGPHHHDDLLCNDKRDHPLDETILPEGFQESDGEAKVDHECQKAHVLKDVLPDTNAAGLAWLGPASDAGHTEGQQTVLDHHADEANERHGGVEEAKTGQQRIPHGYVQEVLHVRAAPRGKGVLGRLVALGLQLEQGVLLVGEALGRFLPLPPNRAASESYWHQDEGDG